MARRNDREMTSAERRAAAHEERLRRQQLRESGQDIPFTRRMEPASQRASAGAVPGPVPGEGAGEGAFEGAGEGRVEVPAESAAGAQDLSAYDVRAYRGRTSKGTRTARTTRAASAGAATRTRRTAADDGQDDTRTTRDTRITAGTRASGSYSDRLRSRESYAQAADKTRRNKCGRNIIIGIAAAVVVVLLAVFGFAQCVSCNLHAGVDQDLRNALVKTDMAKEPFYMLLMGTDGSAERDASEEYGGGSYRSDSIILARIDVPNKKVTLVSIHRDTRVDMGEYGMQKINAAHALGGPAYAVEVVSKMAGVPISHYAEIDFDAFRALVDALGGVEVDVPVDIDDSDAGGSLQAGLQTLNGEQALILCRSRHTYEGTAADPDQMRAANQRLVLSAIAKKLLDADIATIANSVRTASQYVTTDMDLNDIIGLAQALKGLNPETDIYTAMDPSTAVYEDEIWWNITDEDAWREMMRRVDAGLPPVEEGQIDEVTGTVLATAGGEFATGDKSAWISVKNGTDREGLATGAAALLNEAGFVNTVVGEANSSDYEETLVVYDDPAMAYEAQCIVDALGQGTTFLNDGDWFFEGSFLVIIGSDWSSDL